MNLSKQGKLLAILSFLGLTAAVWIARLSSPTAYELDIYGGTPLAFWVLVFPIALIGTASTVYFRDRRRRSFSLSIASFAVLCVLWLPVLRGYWFVDEHDPMTHIGYTKTLIESGMFEELIYPGLHTLSATIAFATGVKIRHALVICAFLVFSISVLWLGVGARLMSRRRYTGSIGVLLGLFFVGLYPLTTDANPDPTQVGVHFASMVLLTLLLAIRRRDYRHLILLGVVLLGLQFFHPLMLVTMLAFSATLIVVRGVFSSRDGIFAWPAPTLLAIGVLSGTIILGFEIVQYRVRIVVIELVTDVDTAAATAGRSQSLAELGTSLLVILVKFLTKDIIVGIGILAALIAWVHYRRSDDSTALTISPIIYLAGLIPVSMLLIVFFVSGQAQIIMRFASLMAIVTVPVAAAGFRELEISGARISTQRLASVGLALLLCIGLIAAIPVMHPAPYSERPGPHVPEGTVASYDTMFKYDNGATYIKLRSDPIRYWDATRGYPTDGYPESIPVPAEGVAPDHFRGLHDEVSGPFYLAVTEMDRYRDGVLWEGLRYDQEDFESLERDRNLHRVHDSERATFYYSDNTTQTRS